MYLCGCDTVTCVPVRLRHGDIAARDMAGHEREIHTHVCELWSGLQYLQWAVAMR